MVQVTAWLKGTSMMSDIQDSEFAALRATIRERGSLRTGLLLAGLVAWGALAVAVAAAQVVGPFRLVPLMILAATFEVTYAIHAGVERIGRYVQVFYEERQTTRDSPAPAAAWETSVTAYARMYPDGGSDPLFIWPLSLAAVLNTGGLFAVGSGGDVALVILFATHVPFLLRMFAVRRQIGAQRAIDLERFRQIRDRK